MKTDQQRIGPMTVQFKRKIRPDGEITGVVIAQFDAVIDLTEEQAASLVRVIASKLGIVTHG